MTKLEKIEDAMSTVMKRITTLKIACALIIVMLVALESTKIQSEYNSWILLVVFFAVIPLYEFISASIFKDAVNCPECSSSLASFLKDRVPLSLNFCPVCGKDLRTEIEE